MGLRSSAKESEAKERLHLRKIRSFVRRGRLTRSQKALKETQFAIAGLVVDQNLIDFNRVFQKEQPVILEIGFGLGQSLLAAAIAHPEKHFIGVETHAPGIAKLIAGIMQHGLTNLRFFEADVTDVLAVIPDASLAGVQIFFPDPWPKRRHVVRRLVQPPFISLLATKLQPGGFLHLATDCEDYAIQMMRVLTSEPALTNEVGSRCFAARAPFRLVVTKFEARALLAGRTIRELRFVKE